MATGPTSSSGKLFLAAVVSLTAATWMGYSVQRVERLRDSGVGLVGTVAGTQITRSNDHDEVKQTYVYRVGEHVYSGAFTPG